MPGVEKAEYMVKTERMVGSQFSVINSDGSNHIEEVMEWVEGERVVLKMHQFVFPLNKLATHFTEVFTFTPSDSFTIVSRKFEMFPKSALSRPILWVISLLLRKAIERHSLEMAINR